MEENPIKLFADAFSKDLSLQAFLVSTLAFTAGSMASGIYLGATQFSPKQNVEVVTQAVPLCKPQVVEKIVERATVYQCPERSNNLCFHEGYVYNPGEMRHYKVEGFSGRMVTHTDICAENSSGKFVWSKLR